MNVQAVIPAGGLGQRLGNDLPKALVPVAGLPLLIRTLLRFEAAGLAANTIVVIPATHRSDFERALHAHFSHADIRLIDGGATRQDSVRRGIAALDDATEICVIHDAARLFITPAEIRAAIHAAAEFGAATVAVPAIDTILQDNGTGFLGSTPDRSLLWACQTPQVFRVPLIRDAHGQAAELDLQVTDDATLLRHFGHPVKLVPGSPRNFKLTTPTDLLVAEALIEKGIECV